MTKTAILIDGGFFRKWSLKKWGGLKAGEAVDKLFDLIDLHLTHEGQAQLYRVFYYDCPPSNKKVENFLTGTVVDMAKNKQAEWANTFLIEVNKRRKVAMRLGKLNDSNAKFTIKPDVAKALVKKERELSSLTIDDMQIVNMTQKGVDMRIGLDIASMAHKKQVNQMILISGDSDFIPVIKYARREGIDFILDSMGAYIQPELFNHLDEHRDLSKNIR